MLQAGMVIIGAGEAGARAAVELRTLGWTGAITLIGEEPHAPYERPPLSKQALLSPDAPSPTYILDDEKLKEHDIEWIAGTPVTAIDRAHRTVRLADGREIAYAKLLLATGARPRQLPLLPMNGTPVAGARYLRTYGDALKLRDKLQTGKRIVIVGAGFIGLEVASSAIERGCKVTVVEVGPRILMRGVPIQIAQIVEERHRAAGVDFRIGISIEAIHCADSDGSVNSLTLADGTTIEYDEMIVGIGAIPETSLAASCGLQLENGICVDETLATSDPSIYAAGDCCSFEHPLYPGRRIRLEAWRNAQDQGTHAASAMLGEKAPFASVPWFWSDQYELTLQVAGLVDFGSETIVRELQDGAKLYFHLADDGRLVAVSGIGDSVVIAKEIRIGQILVETGAKPVPQALGDPDVKLKALLRG
ncbi:NAD(P)/FAD-dependent oxidoreductase [Cohnella silvisoli]|uniref:FAD-dependent oxidoreductase n=1 Tax=Cohnella silvisoli TaxID=2873699 RepID=A0ABV1L1K7_9BACL|nr:FAD-dependent oxidoreductase [Cohnella silvisoli]MCD9025405.1 FAD-dependent oxidoreductase [Cohnella silvisoli]